ncbi:copper homeostasis periplasmic binding protein CopC [Massilia terrae]|uniref:Copper homeostasis periplasmic binding protein CopC n=1 Tax=Massilia terrae TaxID=1811224 RepID=A0ABT2CV01_9BURK|nr:copper homeostasis periplasmic binding protein CopC [Massilia terrae]MCS0657806.1 copper homeostasis periplasmic binding protein CopC [Massilia terrae]
MFAKRLFLAGAFAAGAALATSAQAHAKLQSSDPAAGSIVATAPRQIRLKFNEAVEPAFSKIILSDDKNADIKLPHVEVDKADPSVMTATLPALGHGTFRVQWTAMTHDSHKTKGDFTFQVK